MRARAHTHTHTQRKVKVKEADLYSAFIEVPFLKALRYGSHSVTCKLHRTCLYLVSIHQMAHPRLRLRASNCSLLLIYLPRKDERLSWPGVWFLLVFCSNFVRRCTVFEIFDFKDML